MNSVSAAHARYVKQHCVVRGLHTYIRLSFFSLLHALPQEDAILLVGD